MKQLKSFIILLLIVLIISSVALVAWWNQFTWHWNVFNMFSNNFTPSTFTQPSITVTSPAKGITLVPGQTYPITWTSSGINPNTQIEIRFAPNGWSIPHAGPNDYTIADTSNSGSYNWTVPKQAWLIPGAMSTSNTSEESYYVKIYYTIPSGVYTSSPASASFNITALPCISNFYCAPTQMCSNGICVWNLNAPLQD